jgi:hypothetical protein
MRLIGNERFVVREFCRNEYQTVVLLSNQGVGNALPTSQVAKIFSARCHKSLRVGNRINYTPQLNTQLAENATPFRNTENPTHRTRNEQTQRCRQKSAGAD